MTWCVYPANCFVLSCIAGNFKQAKKLYDDDVDISKHCVKDKPILTTDGKIILKKLLANNFEGIEPYIMWLLDHQFDMDNFIPLRDNDIDELFRGIIKSKWFRSAAPIWNITEKQSSLNDMFKHVCLIEENVQKAQHLWDNCLSQPESDPTLFYECCCENKDIKIIDFLWRVRSGECSISYNQF